MREGGLNRLLRGTRQTVPVTLPPSEGHPDDHKAAMRPLSRAEAQLCISEAVRRFKKMDMPYESALFADHFEDEVLNQILLNAIRVPERDHTFFADGDEIRDFLTPSEQSNLFEIYESNFGDIDPDPSLLNDDQRREIDEAIKKKSVETLRKFGWSELVSYLLTLADRPST